MKSGNDRASVPLSQHLATIQALRQQHKEEVGRLGMRVALLRAALENAGIEPPVADGDELLQMWRHASAVISSASAFVDHLGTSKELVDNLDGRLGRTFGNSPAATAV